MYNMDKILPVTLQKMKNDTHNAFMHEVESVLIAENMASHGFEKHMEALNLALRAEDASLRVRRKNYKTDDLVKLNAYREELYAGFMYQHQSYLRHYDEGLRKAARKIKHLLKSIAFVHNTSNLLRYTHINTILLKLRKPEIAPFIETMQLQGWLDALDNANQQYHSLWMSRLSENAQKGSGNVLSKRVVTDKVYQGIVQRVHALILIDGPENYTHLVRRLNVSIAQERKRIAIRDGWRKHKKTVQAEQEKPDAEEQDEKPTSL